MMVLKTYMEIMNNVLELIKKMRETGWTDEQICNFAIVFHKLITHDPNNIP